MRNSISNQHNYVFVYKLSIIFSAIITLLFISGEGAKADSPTSHSASSTTNVIYAPTTALFPNPERGFYRYFKSRSSDPNSWSISDFTDTDAVGWLNPAEEATITQAYCFFVLDEFLQTNITQSFLQHIDDNLDIVRRAGKKCILRFAYTEDYSDDNGNGIPDVLDEDSVDSEPELPQLVAHIEQLAPILTENVDVIALLQAGFIGIWGEWYYTDHFIDDPSRPWNISENQFSRRRQVVDALLDALPSTRMIALRYPRLKQEMYSRTTALDAGEAHLGTTMARIGFHNDAFINTYGDSGTFSSDADRTYLQTESTYVTMGGEVNSPGTTSNPDAAALPRTCANVVSEMTAYHWSYINTDYHIPTLTAWHNEGCIHTASDISNSVLDRLGYRFRLTQGTYPDSTSIGQSFSFEIKLVNEGFAAPYNPREVYLVLKHNRTAETFSFKLSVDPRKWWAGGTSHTINETIRLNNEMAPGDYQLYLHLPDPQTTLENDPRYAIRLANQHMWADATWDGRNNLLHTMTIARDVPQDTATVAYYMSSSTGGSVNGIRFADEDILAFDPLTHQWAIYFDGSDVGLRKWDVNAFYIMDNGDILLSFNKPKSIDGVTYDDSDIALFEPTSLGSRTRGTFDMYLDGSDVRLTTGGEDIDAIGFTPDGDLVISTLGTAKVGFTARDEDLIRFNATRFGNNTLGTWERYFDGSDIKLSAKAEDVSALWIDVIGQIHLNTIGSYRVNSNGMNLNGDSENIFTCDPVSLGNDVSCYSLALFWNGDNYGYGSESIDGYAVGPMHPDVPFGAPLGRRAVADDEPEENDTLDDDVLDDDEYTEHVYLPLINR